MLHEEEYTDDDINNMHLLSQARYHFAIMILESRPLLQAFIDSNYDNLKALSTLYALSDNDINNALAYRERVWPLIQKIEHSKPHLFRSEWQRKSVMAFLPIAKLFVKTINDDTINYLVDPDDEVTISFDSVVDINNETVELIRKLSNPELPKIEYEESKGPR